MDFVSEVSLHEMLNNLLLKEIVFFFRRDIEPGPGAFLCSCHFIDGKTENGPQLFEHNSKKRFNFSSPEKKKQTAKKQVNGVSTASIIINVLIIRIIITD